MGTLEGGWGSENVPCSKMKSLVLLTSLYMYHRQLHSMYSTNVLPLLSKVDSATEHQAKGLATC